MGLTAFNRARREAAERAARKAESASPLLNKEDIAEKTVVQEEKPVEDTEVKTEPVKAEKKAAAKKA